MSPSPLSVRSSATIALLFLALVGQTWALTVQYCSSDNTASTNRNISIYQSNGLCYQFCLNNYAFAVLQDNACWCSDYVPGDTESTSDCNLKCPGYPDEQCGGSNLYGYIALTKAPSGTQGGSTSTSASQATVTQTPSAITVFITPTTSSETSSSSTSTPSPSSTSSAAPTTTAAAAEAETTERTTTSSTSSPSSSWTPTPITSLETVTDGLVRTITVTPTTPPQQASATSTPEPSKGSSGLGTGGAVGLTIGLVALVALIGAIVFFYYRKKRKEKEAALASLEPERRDSGGTGGGVPSRTMSENSRYMLGHDGRQLVEAWETEPGSRTSRLVPIDPRLNPFSGPYLAASKSRESVNTLRDDHDYSRRVQPQKTVLRMTNPDNSDDDDGK
ncbi:hypothetical protein PVAG01_00433 [Phlyctema vagabunda]|uniref:WSC domain-containing protein n=1 Tax=Phlyctema vagabunda TaxID=108571 RepID=A0ABR4PUI0_9HELO